MVFSTLGGGLTAIDPVTSEIRWTIADGNYAGTPLSSTLTAPLFSGHKCGTRNI